MNEKNWLSVWSLLPPPLSLSLVQQYPLMLNVMSRRCLGMCWARSSRPSLNADCVWWPQDSPHLLTPWHRPPPKLKHNMTNVTKHCAWHFSIALFISPQIRKICLPPTFYFSVTDCVPLHSDVCGDTLTLDVVLQTHCSYSVFSATHLVFKASLTPDSVLSTCFRMPCVLCSFLCTFFLPPLSVFDSSHVNWTFALDGFYCVFILLIFFCLVVDFVWCLSASFVRLLFPLIKHQCKYCSSV